MCDSPDHGETPDLVTQGTFRMGKQGRKSAKRRSNKAPKLPPLSRAAIVAIIQDGAESKAQEAQLASHQVRVQKLLQECVGDMNPTRSRGYLREAMRDRGVLEEDLWVMLQDFRRDPGLKRELVALAEQFKARAELRVQVSRISDGLRSDPPDRRGRTQARITRKRSRKTKSVWLVQLGRGPKPVRRKGSR